MPPPHGGGGEGKSLTTDILNLVMKTYVYRENIFVFFSSQTWGFLVS